MEQKTVLLGHRYRMIEKLGSGSMSDVFRAVDKLSGESVALKRLKVEEFNFLLEAHKIAPMDTSDFRLGLVHEFKTLASLRHPNIVSVLDYGFDSNLQPYFTMELLTQATPLSAAAFQRGFSAKIDLMIQLLQALTYLHRRGIIHCDIKPDNVLVMDDQVKVLDFGLSITKKTVPELQNTISGTLAYMAPELIEGVPPSEASDLYAVGVLLYQILSGKLPFPTDSITALISNIMYTEPDMTLLNISPELQVIVQRLLAKQPSDRFSSVAEVIAALAQATDLRLSIETPITRESFLQGAQFVGRETELGLLSEALDKAVEGRGSLWLIGGESGIGKSRLVEELRILALTRGATVLRGQTVSEGAAPYQFWQNILRQMVLNVGISDEEAGILKAIIYNLETLLERSIPDVLTRDAQTAQERIYATVESLFKRQQTPLLLILEDLHWAHEFDLLARVATHLNNLPIMVVGSYRDDEQPNLPDQFPTAQTIQLARFDPQSVLAFTNALLGRDTSRHGFNDFLYQQTEGNIFFIIEVMRSLAEETGRLDMVTEMTLPQSVFTRGVQQVLQRRLDRISETSQQSLKMAAIIGRQIDINLLRQLTPALDTNVWLVECEEASLLDAHESDWRFVHDKIREMLLREIPPAEQQRLHLRVAEAIIAVYGEAPEQLSRLGYHWEKAGDFGRAIDYYEKAADFAMANGLNREAMSRYEQALNMLSSLEENETTQRRLIDLALKYARVGAYTRSPRIQAALEQATALAQALGDEALQARTLAGTGTFFYISGQLGMALRYFQQSIQFAENQHLEELLILPYNILGRAIIVSGDTRKGDALLSRGIGLAEKYQDRELHAGSQAFYAGNLLMMGRREEGLSATEKALALAENLGHSSRIAGNYMSIGYGHCFAGMFDEAVMYLEKCATLARENQDFHPLYVSLGCLGYIALQKGEHETALTYLDQALAMIGEALVLPNATLYLACRAEIDRLAGDITSARERTAKALAVAEQASQVMNKGQILLVQGRLEAADDLEKGAALMQQSIAIHEQCGAVALQAMSRFELGKLYLSYGQPESAEPILKQALEMFETYAMPWHREAAMHLLSQSGKAS